MTLLIRSTSLIHFSAPWKGGGGGRMYLFRCDFSSCSGSAEIGHANSFCVKKCPCVFCLHKWGNEASNTLLEAPLPPPPPSSGVIEILQCLETDTEGGGDFCAIWSIFFCLLDKKTRTFFNTKRVGMPNFSGFRATWKITTKWLHVLPFHGALQLLLKCTFWTSELKG